MRDCANCIRSKGATQWDNGCTSWDCDFIDRAEAIKVYKESKWIPISVKPDAGQMGTDYLVYTEFGIGIATYYPNGEWSGYDVLGDGFDESIILAWKQLPEPWEGE